MRKIEGKFGDFLGCSNYPDCRYTFNLDDDEGEDFGACPECGGGLRKIEGKFGDFLGCSNYPECKFTKKLDYFFFFNEIVLIFNIFTIFFLKKINNYN